MKDSEFGKKKKEEEEERIIPIINILTRQDRVNFLDIDSVCNCLLSVLLQ